MSTAPHNPRLLLRMTRQRVRAWLDLNHSSALVQPHRAHLFAKLALGHDNELGRWLTRQAWWVGNGV